MLRVGLTGALGSGKSAVAALLAERGAVVYSSDDMARAMMQPGHAVYDAIVARFGAQVVSADKTLNRRALAQLAFDAGNPRVDELNAVVHPAVIAEQGRCIAAVAASQPHAIVVVESALLLTARHTGGRSWRERFDVIVVVTAPEETMIERFVARSTGAAKHNASTRAAARAEAQRRLAAQHWTPEQSRDALTLHNDGTLDELKIQVDLLWHELLHRERAIAATP